MYPKDSLAMTVLETHGCVKLLKVTTKAGMTVPHIVGPPDDDELGLAPIFPKHLCAMCGKAKKDDGGTLDGCSKCKDRKYCGKACQKKHWKYHTIICSYPEQRMRAFLDSVPLDCAADVKGMEKAMTTCGDLRTAMSGYWTTRRWKEGEDFKSQHET